LFSGPEVKAMLATIMIGSTLKGMVAGIIIGLVARKVRNMKIGIIVGVIVGFALAFIVAALPAEGGQHYWLEILIPGTLVGLILGFLTQKYGKSVPSLK
jgi:F0F1-type ATP synthase assembly protein I